MSVEAISWAFRQEVTNGGTKLLLVALANSAGKSGVAFPGRETLAQVCCWERPATVTANMKLLEEAGLIERIERRRKNGSKTTPWVVLAPYAVDRGEMFDAPSDEYPEAVAAAAKRGSETESDPGTKTAPNVAPSGTENVPAQVRKTGGPDPLEEPERQEDEADASSSNDSTDVESSPPNPLIRDFEGWLAYHQAVTGDEPPREGTKARQAVEASYRARRTEGTEPYSAADLLVAIDGAWSDDFRRENGHYGCESVLRPTKIHELIQKGRRAGGQAKPDWAAWVAEQLPELEGYEAQRAASMASMLKLGRYEVTPELVRQRLEQRVGVDLEAA